MIADAEVPLNYLFAAAMVPIVYRLAVGLWPNMASMPASVEMACYLCIQVSASLAAHSHSLHVI